MKLLILLSCLLSACSLSNRVPIGTIPAAEPPDSKASSTAIQGLIGLATSQGHRVTQRGPQYARIKKIWDRLSLAAGGRTDLWPVVIINARKEANASAVNGAAMGVTQALIDRIKDDSELATVLAHELGHILAKHHERALRQNHSIKSDSNVITGFSKSQEYDADRIGLMLMAKAGFNPKVALIFWRRADSILGDDYNSKSHSTHPTYEERLRNLEEALPYALNYYSKHNLS